MGTDVSSQSPKSLRPVLSMPSLTNTRAVTRWLPRLQGRLLQGAREVCVVHRRGRGRLRLVIAVHVVQVHGYARAGVIGFEGAA